MWAGKNKHLTRVSIYVHSEGQVRHTEQKLRKFQLSSHKSNVLPTELPEGFFCDSYLELGRALGQTLDRLLVFKRYLDCLERLEQRFTPSSKAFIQ